MNPDSSIRWDKNVIHVASISSTRDMWSLLRALHVLICEQGFNDVHLDFSQCDKAFARAMLPIVTRMVAYRESDQTEFFLDLPKDAKLRKLFENTNWAHYIRPKEYQTKHTGDRHVPMIQFGEGSGIDQAVKSILDVILSNIQGITKEQMKALEWSLSEITDNVLNHAQSDIGGFVQATAFTEHPVIEFVVADPGIGIPQSLDMVGRDTEALEYAVREGGTRNDQTNGGNGLFGSLRIAALSGGEFHLHSQCASLDAGDQGIRCRGHKVPYNGTAVVSKINYEDETRLDEALLFQGKVHDPVSPYMEQTYQKGDSEDMEFQMKEEASSFRSRRGGEQTRVKMRNLLDQNPAAKMTVSFRDVNVITSSFADEVFGRLFAELGPIRFMKQIDIINAEPLVNQLIEHAINQRTSLEFRRNNGHSPGKKDDNPTRSSGSSNA